MQQSAAVPRSPSVPQHRLSHSAGWHQHLNQACKWANEVLPSLCTAAGDFCSIRHTSLPRLLCGLRRAEEEEAVNDRIGEQSCKACRAMLQSWEAGLRKHLAAGVWAAELMACGCAGGNMPRGDELLWYSVEWFVLVPFVSFLITQKHLRYLHWHIKHLLPQKNLTPDKNLCGCYVYEFSTGVQMRFSFCQCWEKIWSFRALNSSRTVTPGGLQNFKQPFKTFPAKIFLLWIWFSNTSESFGSGAKKGCELLNALKTPVWNISQVNRW